MRCVARACPIETAHIVCAPHQALLPENIKRALRCWKPSPERERAILAAIGCIAMREERAVTAAERSALNRFVE